MLTSVYSTYDWRVNCITCRTFCSSYSIIGTEKYSYWEFRLQLFCINKYVKKTYKNESGHPPSVAGWTVINLSKSKRIKQISSAIWKKIARAKINIDFLIPYRYFFTYLDISYIRILPLAKARWTDWLINWIIISSPKYSRINPEMHWELGYLWSLLTKAS